MKKKKRKEEEGLTMTAADMQALPCWGVSEGNGKREKGVGGERKQGERKEEWGNCLYKSSAKQKRGGVSNGSKEKSMTKAFHSNTILRALTHYLPDDTLRLPWLKEKRSVQPQLSWDQFSPGLAITKVLRYSYTTLPYSTVK